MAKRPPDHHGRLIGDEHMREITIGPQRCDLGGLGEHGLLPDCPGPVVVEEVKPQEADGLEWLLRLGVLWQQVAASPLRRTQQRDFFKRDLDRLRSDSLLGAAPTENLADVPDAGLLADPASAPCRVGARQRSVAASGSSR